MKFLSSNYSSAIYDKHPQDKKKPFMDGVQLSEGWEEKVFFLPLPYQEIMVLIWYFST